MTKTEPSEINSYSSPEYALSYLAKSDRIPHRTEGEAVVLELLPEGARRVLDLGTGDGRLMALVKLVHPEIQGVVTDISPTMLEKARSRFAENHDISVVEHDLNDSLPDIGTFDVILSSFSIHHVSDERKQRLYKEIFNILDPGGIFCNLEHVSSRTDKLHEDFYHAMGAALSEEDPSNKCASVEIQLDWMQQIGFKDVDCFWKWRELALLSGKKPA
ncbi:MAG: class I SAM-dependent methyltransferase [Acidobacteriota bacterium]|jgi:tRNA (cmo5U34)-methyltransferase